MKTCKRATCRIGETETGRGDAPAARLRFADSEGVPTGCANRQARGLGANGRRGGFSLVEVLLAIFILGIGMIMVASVFPVGANWTRQTTEESVAQSVADNAMSVINVHFGAGGDLQAYVAPDFSNPMNFNTVLKSPTPFRLQAIPGFTLVPVRERAYQFGSASPYPATNALACTYFWTALMRLNPAHKNPVDGSILPSASFKYDLYILVFRKGAVEHQFTSPFVPGTRSAVGEDFVPVVQSAGYGPGQHDPSRTPSIFGSTPPMGGIGIGIDSGTVFRQVLDKTVDLSVAGPNGAIPRPLRMGGENIIYSPPADNTSASPLIYVYQTTLSM